MSAWDAIGIILGSSVLVALVNLLSDRFRRKDIVKDKQDDMAAQLDVLRTETSEQFEQVDKRFMVIERDVKTIDTNTQNIARSNKVQAYDRIRHLSLSHIKNGYITADELENLEDMYGAYKALGGDGILDKLMRDVGKLHIKSDD